MTADEYKELRERIKKYEWLNENVRVLKRHRENCENGISIIRPINKLNSEEITCWYNCMGDGFQELVTQKVIEAFDEQIIRIEKQMEEL